MVLQAHSSHRDCCGRIEDNRITQEPDIRFSGSPVQEDSQVEIQIGSESHELDLLIDQIERLEARLSCVLKTSYPYPTPESGECTKEEELVPLAIKLRNNRRKVAAALFMVGSIHARLEL